MKPTTVKGLIGAYRQTYYGKNFGLGHQVDVKDFIIHPGYSCHGVTDDIALLELDENLTFTDEIQMGSLPMQQSSLIEDTPVTVMGWGWDNENFLDGNRPEILQKASVRVIGNERCQQSYQQNNKQNVIVETQLCAGRLTGGVDACWVSNYRALELVYFINFQELLQLGSLLHTGALFTSNFNFIYFLSRVSLLHVGRLTQADP